MKPSVQWISRLGLNSIFQDQRFASTGLMSHSKLSGSQNHGVKLE
jgi:hypothetical protein